VVEFIGIPGAGKTTLAHALAQLNMAKKNATRTDYRLMSSREAISTFGECSFDLILAFRFFPNAEGSLRRSVAADLTRLVSNQGAIILNNHRNFWSTSYIARRIAGQPPHGALNGEIEQIFANQGLRVARKFSLGVWPQGELNSPLLSWSAIGKIERANMSWLSQRHSIGYNTIWVLSKT